MKEFNLEAAKAGAPVCTRDGRKARIICFDKNCPRLPIVALITTGDGVEETQSYTDNGRFFANDVNNSDLMMVTTKHEGWMNLFASDPKADYIAKGGCIFDSFEKAKQAYVENCHFATIKVEWED